jgi:hypothetical protein
LLGPQTLQFLRNRTSPIPPSLLTPAAMASRVVIGLGMS